MSGEDAEPLKRQAQACGFDPEDAAVVAWWTALPAAERKELLRLSGRRGLGRGGAITGLDLSACDIRLKLG
jgi:hypothetical protein